MKTEGYLTIGAIILLVVVGGYILISKNSEAPATQSSLNLSDSLNQEKKADPNSVLGSSAEAESNLADRIPDAQKKEEPMAKPKLEIDAKKIYSAILKTTEGDIKIEFNAAATPITVNNFVTLAKKNFYDGTIFHRTIKGFMIQGGDPKGNGTGGPGYKFDDEKFDGEYTRGTIAMANAGPNTNGSQFFIMHKDYPLPKNYVIFGKVIEGIEVVDKIAEAPTKVDGRENSSPVSPVKITSVVVEEK